MYSKVTVGLINIPANDLHSNVRGGSNVLVLFILCLVAFVEFPPHPTEKLLQQATKCNTLLT